MMQLIQKFFSNQPSSRDDAKQRLKLTMESPQRGLARGEFLYLPGEEAEVVYILVSGRIKISRIQENGREKLANDCIVKPFNTRDLIDRVRYLINSDPSKSRPQPPRRPSHPGL